MSGDLAVRPFVAEDAPAWDTFVRGHPQGTFFHLSAWRDHVCEVFGHRDQYLIARRGQEIAGVLPLFHVPTLSPSLMPPRTTRWSLVSTPYATYGGPIGDGDATAALRQTALDLGDELGAAQMEFRYRDDAGPLGGDATTDLYAGFIRELPKAAQCADALMLFPRKARAAARQGRDRFGLEFGEGRWYLQDLYDLYFMNKKALGTPALPFSFFEGLDDRFGEDVVTHVVRYRRLPVAAVLSFRFGDTLLPYYSGFRPGYNHVRANNFMYYRLVAYAIETGCRWFDFGRSRTNAGPYSFKVNQGWEPQRLHYRFIGVRKTGRPSSFNPSNPRTRLLRKAWSLVPDALAEPVGERLSRYLP